mgnify:CR=1 FL=1
MNETRLLQTFLDLLRIESPPGREQEVAAYLQRALAQLGAQTEIDAAGNLLAVLPGPGPWVALNAHMDTVDTTAGLEPIVAEGCIRSNGRTVLGADDKAGIAVILEAVRSLCESDQPRAALELIFTVREERGLVGAKQFDISRLRSPYCFVFDSSQPVGHFVVQQPSQEKLFVTIRGRRAHAGVAPEQGINAIVAAARALATMPLGRIDAETTANVGVIRGGESTNIVPDLVEVQLEARSHSQEKLARQVQAMLDAFTQACAALGAQLTVEREQSYRAYRLAESEPVVQRALAAARACGFEPALHASGGGSDANIFNERGLPSIVVGLDYREIHSPNEYIPIASLCAATRLAEALIRAE